VGRFNFVRLLGAKPHEHYAYRRGSGRRAGILAFVLHVRQGCRGLLRRPELLIWVGCGYHDNTEIVVNTVKRAAQGSGISHYRHTVAVCAPTKGAVSSPIVAS